MTHYLFYCPRCKYEKIIDKIPRGSLGNCRDGFGRPIYHSICPECGNLDAGCISQDYDYKNDGFIEGDRHIISLYQNIRTTEPYYDWRKDSNDY